VEINYLTVKMLKFSFFYYSDRDILDLYEMGSMFSHFSKEHDPLVKKCLCSLAVMSCVCVCCRAWMG